MAAAAASAPIQFNVAGVTYNAGKHMSAADMEKLTHVQLIPEPDNEYDETAIAVYASDGGGQQVQLGYVPVDHLPTAHHGKWTDRAWKIADCGHFGRLLPYVTIEETYTTTTAATMEPANKKARVTTPTELVPAPFRPADSHTRLAWAKTLMYQLPQEILENVLRHTPPPASVKRGMDAVITELQKVVADCFKKLLEQPQSSLTYFWPDEGPWGGPSFWDHDSLLTKLFTKYFFYGLKWPDCLLLNAPTRTGS